MAQAPAVQIRYPIITKQIAVGVPFISGEFVYDIDVPYAVVEKVQLYMPMGVNYSLRVGFGYNGKKLIPFDQPNEWIIGPGFTHEYRWGIPVYGKVQVIVEQFNRIPHIIWVALHMNYEPIQAATDQRRMITP